ncbi:RagB/SusD family nutrient uptake outer membrane protein [Parabacteroides provencensis]|uniref:RagB/SusD family nutrient uptake outer membrane protein n=1 Tax=Parabacteroides provencensis TaxID=1944636 RepID=UPI000C15B9F0|nr:RagB/SusD family nutrient uptake outer membrane protein [Parabacteroides provencensis]
MKTLTYKHILPVMVLGLTLSTNSCINDLDTIPLSKDELVSETTFGSDLAPYTGSLAKIYAGFVIGGNSGGDADQDVAGIDGGSQASFLRCTWNMQELTTDEAHCAWNDPGIPDFNNVTWGASNPWIKGSYYRLYYQINVANAFLRETTEDKLRGRGCSDQTINSILSYRAQARFLRALAYAYTLDFYRNVPFVTEEGKIGNVLPEQIMAADLFNYIEKELKECQERLSEPTVGFSATYGEANKAAAWSLLSRLYLNAEVYIGQPKYTECIEYCNKVINAGYALGSDYLEIFKADNDHSAEMIFPLRYEGDQTMTWGGMTFLLCGLEPKELMDEIHAKDAWQGVRAKSSLLATFEKENASDQDSRKALLHPELTSSNEIVDPFSFKDNGIPTVKFYNVNKDGSLPPSKEAWVDFPMFRLGEIYLNYAEAVLRGGTGGDKATALKYVNAIRERAYKDKSVAPITQSQLTLDFLLDEKGREFFYEAHRRTDLIRYGKFTGSDYLWPWKGGVAQGTSVKDMYKVFPLPSDDIGSNTNLKQNDGY